MRQHTQRKDLVRAGVTRFAMIFLMLQSILAALTSLKQMFVSGEWLNSPYSKKPEGEAIACIVFDNQFAQRAAEIVKVSEPLVRVLRLVDGDKTPMGYLYEAMDRAKESIKNYYKGDRLKFDPIWEIVDRRWNNQLHQPIHAAGYFLNPHFRFGGSYSDSNGEVMEGLSTCIERMVPDVEERDLIVSELQNYEGGRGKLFSSELARRGRTTQTPDAWWQNWGGNTPHLKKFALRVLCQPCNSSNYFSRPFELECNASGEGIGAILMQDKHPIAFESQKLWGGKRGYSIYEKVMLAIMHALAKYRQYLVGSKFVVKTDHNSLKHFINQRDLNDGQQKWVSKLQSYNFDIVYVKGKKNIVADALSRRLHLCFLGEIAADWKEWISVEYAKDKWASDIIDGTIGDDRYIVVNDLIIYKEKIVLIPGSRMKKKVLKAFHDIPLAGHPATSRLTNKFRNGLLGKGSKLNS
ncbi:uncharacterized protein LOC131860220 [Cryptomeria japonica]|uniref:uncharacterized protein LOC131860220 n=1 Tax=Cryptomeria japonica TaxID=3369 RepID=UPI0027DA21AD|nr:uncharacterized protein LOC131860220 [Cryptomeria japonica]